MGRIIRKRLKDPSCDQSKTKFDYNKLTALIKTKIKEHSEKKWTRFLDKLCRSNLNEFNNDHMDQIVNCVQYVNYQISENDLFGLNELRSV